MVICGVKTIGFLLAFVDLAVLLQLNLSKTKLTITSTDSKRVIFNNIGIWVDVR
jgi:hypothetical protein